MEDIWTPENLPIIKKIINQSFWIGLNANDFFAYACADCVDMDPFDLEWVVPIVKKYPTSGLDACQAYIRKQMPIPPYITEEFNQAYEEICTLKPNVRSE